MGSPFLFHSACQSRLPAIQAVFDISAAAQASRGDCVENVLFNQGLQHCWLRKILYTRKTEVTMYIVARANSSISGVITT